MTAVIFAMRQIGLTGCVILALLAYYEGVPGLRDIPYLDRLPVARDLLAGRVAKQAAIAADAAQRTERWLWQEQQRLADALLERQRADAQRRIDEADAAYMAGQMVTAARYATLEDILARERADNAQNNGGACRPVMPDSVWRALNGIGG